MKGRILVAEDDNLSRENLVELLKASGHEVKAVRNGREAKDASLEDSYDLVITDLKMPEVDGLELLRFMKEIDPPRPVIIITGYGAVDTAVETMKLGAFDYITKPLKENFIELTVERALAYARLTKENANLKDHLREKYDFGKMIGYSDCLNRVFEVIKKVSSSDSTVIIYGESGTGKELVARAIHFNSHRRSYPLVPINCGAIPEDLLESELFGHEKGAFTGAITSRAGRFEIARGGTIFLDEIGDMSPSLQVKVLRVLQEKQFERVGGMRTIHADVRIIAATNQNLERAVTEKRFREDLFYRINVIPIHLPPLRERGSDITILTNHFLGIFNKLKRKKIQGITPEALKCFMQYSWPGNVRELQNLVEMLVVMKEGGFIDVEDLTPKIRNHRKERGTIVDLPEGGINFNDMVSQFEKDLLLKALGKSGGVKNRAAKLLQLNRTTLIEKLKRYNIALGEHEAHQM